MDSHMQKLREEILTIVGKEFDTAVALGRASGMNTVSLNINRIIPIKPARPALKSLQDIMLAWGSMKFHRLSEAEQDMWQGIEGAGYAWEDEHVTVILDFQQEAILYEQYDNNDGARIDAGRIAMVGYF